MAKCSTQFLTSHPFLNHSPLMTCVPETIIRPTPYSKLALKPNYYSLHDTEAEDKGEIALYLLNIHGSQVLTRWMPFQRHTMVIYPIVVELRDDLDTGIAAPVNLNVGTGALEASDLEVVCEGGSCGVWKSSLGDVYSCRFPRVLNGGNCCLKKR